MLTARLLCLFPLVCAAAPQPAISYKVQDKFIPSPLENVRLQGVLQERMKVNLERRLLNVDEEALLAGFEKRPGTHPWIGEHVGKYLHAAANTWRYTHDERLKAQMDRMAKRLIAAQLPDGYLGTYTDDQRWTSWDVWVHKYDLIGLLAYYEATGYEPALAAARKVGDLLERTFGDTPGKRDIIAASTHVGMAASSVLEPMCQLYRWTGEPRYLAFAEYIVRSWNQPNGPKIVRSLLEHGDVHRTANGKAYEMMSCLVGLLELGRLTANPTYFTVAENAWKDITANRLYVTGTTSAHEHFQGDRVLPGGPSDDVGEGCATVTWLQLNWHLLRLRNEQKYAEELERTIYNQLLAAQDPANGNICYFTPEVGWKNATPGINCCVSSEPRGISMIPQAGWGTGENGAVFLNLYEPATITAPGKKITVESDFPASGKMLVRVNSTERFCLNLRTPAWTNSFTAKYGRERDNGIPGQPLAICRTWKPGDEVEITMNMTVRELDGAPSYPGMFAFQRGPQVLAVDAAQNPALRYLHRTARGEGSLVTAADNRYRLSGVTQGDTGEFRKEILTLIPFADAKLYRIWLARSFTLLSTEPPALTAAARESTSRAGTHRGSFTDEKRETYTTTDSGALRGEDWCAVQLPQPVAVARVVFQHGTPSDNAGYFTEPPRVEIRRTERGAWEPLGVLAGYTEMNRRRDGARFELRLERPVELVALRVIGKPEGFITCAEVSGYAK